VCRISGSQVIFDVGVGVCTLTVNNPGNSNYFAAIEVQQSFIVGPGTQVIIGSTNPASAIVGGATFTPVSSSSSGLTVLVGVDASSAGICSITSGIVAFVGAGNCVLVYSQAGNALWNPIVQQSIFVVRLNQTVSFSTTAPVNPQVGSSVYVALATSSSGLSVTYSTNDNNICTVGTGGNVRFVGVGSCLLSALSAATTNFIAASASQAINVTKGDQTVNVTSNAPTGVTVGTLYTVVATASSGLTPTVVISPLSVPFCTVVSGLQIRFTAVGTCVFTIVQIGNTNWNAAVPTVTQTVDIAIGFQIVSFSSAAPTDAYVSGPAYQPLFSSNAGLAVTLTSNSAVCAYSNGLVTFVSLGACVLNASSVS
jgi:hypothetical protein